MGRTAPLSTLQDPQGRSSLKWWICILLLLATTLNYMDRQALSQTQVQVKKTFEIDSAQYSYLGAGFNIGYGIGALLFGWLVDRGNLRWIYAGLVLAWSTVGFATGYVTDFTALIVCRLLLGIFESGNWPCGIMTVKRVLKPEERTLGNGMFQSGTALGAILVPLVVIACFRFGDRTDPHAWQVPFRVVGMAGIFWAILWLFTVSNQQLAPAAAEAAQKIQANSYWELWLDRRFYVMIAVVVGVNAPWRSLGEWMPGFLQEDKHYDFETIQWYSSAFYLAADLGSIVAGLITLRMARSGRSLFASRMVPFLVCVLLTLLIVLVVALPKGWLLFATLLLVAFGSLGSFSTYFAFSQEISAAHQGKVTGTLGVINAICMAALVRIQGGHIKATHSYDLSLGLTAIGPLVAIIAVGFFWNRPASRSRGISA